MHLHSAHRQPKILPLAAILALVTSLSPPDCRGQDQNFSSATQVIAADVLVDAGPELPRKARKALLSGTLLPTDLEIRFDGLPRPVIGIEAPSADTQPWNLLLYFDATLHPREEMAWAASMLSRSAPTLSKLGSIDIVVASPDPKWLLRNSRDDQEIQEVLARLILQPSGEETLGQMRRAYLRGKKASPEPPSSESGSDSDAAVEDIPTDGAALARLETRLIRERLDTLLLHLSDSSANPRRAIFWVGGGFELDPHGFYGLSAQGEESTDSGSPIRSWSHEFKKVLSAYGWVGFPLLKPLPENRAGIKPGKRIGKFRFHSPRTGPPFLAILSATYEEDRDPERAEAFYQLGLSFSDSGDHEQAAENFQKSIFHFYGDPRTGERQAQVYQSLGESLEHLGREHDAQQAFEAGRELLSLEGSSNEGAGTMADNAIQSPGLTDIDASALAELVADATAGAVVSDPNSLEGALDSLTRRVRVTYQLDGPPKGETRTLDINIAGGSQQVRSPTWGRTGSLGVMTEARIRQAIRQGEVLDTLDMESIRLLLGPVLLGPDTATGLGGLPEADSLAILEIDLQEWLDSGAMLRLTIATSYFEDEPVFSHETIDTSELEDSLFRWKISPGAEKKLWVIALENLLTGEKKLLTLEPSQQLDLTAP